MSADRHPEYFNFFIKRADTIKSDKKEQALFSLDSALRAFPDPGNGDVFSVDSMKCVLYGFPIKNYSKALLYADSMFLIDNGSYRTEEEAERTTWALFAKAYCYRLIPDYSAALNYFLAGQEIGSRHVKHQCDLEKFEAGVGYLFYAQGKFQLAASHFLKQHEFIRNNCNNNDFVDDFRLSYADASVSYLMAGMMDSAWFYAIETLKILDDQEKKFPERAAYLDYARSVVYSFQADVMSQKGIGEKAEELYKKSIEGTKVLDFAFSEYEKLSLSKFYLKNNEIKKFNTVLAEIKRSLDTLPDDPLLAKWLNLKATYFANAKNHDSAFYFQMQYNKVNDSIDTKNKGFGALDIRNEYENLELKYFHESLEKEASLKNLYLIISLLVFMMAISIATIVWFNFKKMTKLNLRIQQKGIDLQKAFSSLEQSHAENTRIMRIVAHDLKNPMSAIQNVVHSLLQKEKLESQREMFIAIQSCCNDSMSLIKDLLEEKKDQRKEKEHVEISELLQNCVQLLQSKADEKKQKLNFRADHVEMIISRQKIWRVMSNLISNAIKFSPIRSVIDIKLEKNTDKILLSVSDRGIGIPENLKTKIFEMSDEAVRPGTEGEKSYGLGLSISKKIVEEYNGKLWFESKESEGSVFYVELPVS